MDQASRSEAANVLRDIAGWIERGLIEGIELKWRPEEDNSIHVVATFKVEKPAKQVEVPKELIK